MTFQPFLLSICRIKLCFPLHPLASLLPFLLSFFPFSSLSIRSLLTFLQFPTAFSPYLSPYHPHPIINCFPPNPFPLYPPPVSIAFSPSFPHSFPISSYLLHSYPPSFLPPPLSSFLRPDLVRPYLIQTERMKKNFSLFLLFSFSLP